MYIILDTARGWAALAVFMFHLNDALAQSLPWLAKLTAYGSLGVPLFFVISGYVITAAAEGSLKKPGSANEFLRRRFLRIFPPFWASVAVVLAVPYLLEALSFLKTGHYVWPNNLIRVLSAGEWVQLMTLTKVFGTPTGDLQAEFSPINSVYWTLAIEFQFYLCVYVALIFRRFFHLIILGITVASLVLLRYPLPLDGGLFIHFWPMFATGIVVFYLRKRRFTLGRLGDSAVRLSATLTVASIFLVACLAYAGKLGDVLQAMFSSATLGFAVVSALILWLAEPLEAPLARYLQHGHLLARGVIRGSTFLGMISYSLYLLHAKVLEGPAMVARQVFSPTTPAYIALVILGTLALCTVFHIYVEKPFMSSKQKRHLSYPAEATSSPVAQILPSTSKSVPDPAQPVG
jgi:peptidoglycan/LPS O-acetylase OafA/YrhL